MSDPEEPNIEDEEPEVVAAEDLEIDPPGRPATDRFARLSGRAQFAVVFIPLAAVLLGVLLGVVFSVGGSGGTGERVHQLAAVESCLVKAGAKASTTLPANEVVASTALGGALLVQLPGNTLVLMFAGSSTDARNLYLAQKSFTPPAYRKLIDTLLFDQGDVVSKWTIGPTGPQLATLAACLK